MAKQNKKPNQDRIEKLKGLKAENESPKFAGRFTNQINVKAIIKLNEELTTENSRLLTELDGITSDKDMAELNYNSCVEVIKQLRVDYADLTQINKQLVIGAKDRIDKAKIDLRIELTSIKSKWWYKLMTWGWR